VDHEKKFPTAARPDGTGNQASEKEMLFQIGPNFRIARFSWALT
jgi:hypothetical protein